MSIAHQNAVRRLTCDGFNLWGASLPRPIGRVRTSRAWLDGFAGVQGVEKCASRAPCTPQAGAGKQLAKTHTSGHKWPPGARRRSPSRPASPPVGGGRSLLVNRCQNVSCNAFDSARGAGQPERRFEERKSTFEPLLFLFATQPTATNTVPSSGGWFLRCLLVWISPAGH
jgi:hypothetical protein